MKIFIESKMEMKKSKKLHVGAFIISEIKAEKSKKAIYIFNNNPLSYRQNFILFDN